jgi:hypothetical protein
MHMIRKSQHQRSTAYTFAATLVALLLVVAVAPALAMPRDPIEPDPLPIDDSDYPVPDNGFEWRMPARYGVYENGMVDFHWIEDDAIYEEEHVNPNEFIVIFDGCRTWAEEETGTSSLTYTWTIDGQVTSGGACRIQHAFLAQGTYVATLRITQDGTVLIDSQGRGDPFTQWIVVKDFLIVSIGDSYASGEGNPDRWQQLTGSDILGNPTDATPAVWQDRRCHRSALSAPAQAALMLEMADPHSSVTFLSFACSGATINTHFYDDAPFYDPYRKAPEWPLVKDRGSGILGPGCGQEPPYPDQPQLSQLPSQMSQLMTALTNDGDLPPRPVDALLISAGGNDMGFVPVIMLCALYWDCEDILVSSQYGGWKTLQSRVSDDVNALEDLYAALAAEIQEYIPFSPNGRVYITQYPDPTSNSGGGYCDEMLKDVIPWWVGTISEIGAIFDGAPFVPLPPYRMDQDEATWAGGTVGPALNSAVAAAAQTHGWIMVDGINDSTGNLFATHGYCAADNWIRTATESVDIQGPWAYWIVPTWPANSTATTGTMHPTADGNRAIAQRILAKMRPFLLPAGEPPGPPTFTSTSNDAIVSSSGWLTGHAAGATCPAGAADCTFAQVVATAPANTALNGASLVKDGVPVACSPTGVTTGGLTCRGEQTTNGIYTWSLAFATDGVYQLGFSASSTNGSVATYSRQVKVDLTDPVANHTLSSGPHASGWFLSPITVTVTAVDGRGSGPAALEYWLDGITYVEGGNGGAIAVHEDGGHWLQYRVADAAGRTSAWQSVPLPIDQTAPVSVVSVSPPANDNGWHTRSSVEVTLSTTEVETSGLAGLTYSATGAQPIPSTTVDNDDQVSVSITEEGETTLSFFTTDHAGNVEATKTVTVRLDRTAPVSTASVSPAANSNGWHSGSYVEVTLRTTDSGGSGLAGLTYSATGAQPISSTTVDNDDTDALLITAEGQTTISFFTSDAAGNVEAAKTVTVRIDRSAPVVTCASADGQWHASDVSLACTASDSGSGLAETSPASFSLSTSVAEGAESADALTGSQTVCDALGNCVTAGPLGGNKVDKKGPTITITAPASQSYLLNESIDAGYSCADGGSGVATCAGPVVSGSPVDTTSPGAQSFTVNATDSVGNTANQSVSYNVAYGVCVLFDQTKAYKLGSTIPIKLQLCDAGSSNMSTADMVLHATGLTKKDSTASGTVEDAGNSNPDSDFRFDAALAGYIFNLSTKGLSTGTWALSFTVTNDPVPYSIEFDVR